MKIYGFTVVNHCVQCQVHGCVSQCCNWRQGKVECANLSNFMLAKTLIMASLLEGGLQFVCYLM